jgi:hypothetical protein
LASEVEIYRRVLVRMIVVGVKREETFDSLVAVLGEDEKIVLCEIAHIFKIGSRVFDERQLQRKRRCWEIEVIEVLKSLQDKGLVQQVDPGKHLWRVTSEYCALEHRLEDEAYRKDYPGMRIVR